MSTRKTRREKIRSEQRRLRIKNSELYKLTKLKKELEERIPEERRKKNIAFHIRNLKIVRDTGRFLVPFVVCAGLAVGAGALFGAGLPLRQDEHVKPKLTTFNMHSPGEYKVMEEEYISLGFGDTVKDSSLTIYTPWEEVHDGFHSFEEKPKVYRREKRVYGSSVKSYEVIKALMNNDFEYILKSIDDYKIEVQTCNELHEEPTFMVEGSINILDRDDYISTKESPSDDLVVTIIEALLALGVGGIIAYKRDYEYIWQIKKDLREYRHKYNTWKEDTIKLKETNEQLLTLRRGGR